MPQECSPELALIRVAAVVSGYMSKADPHEALGDIIAILEAAAVPWPRSAHDRKVILDAWRMSQLIAKGPPNPTEFG